MTSNTTRSLVHTVAQILFLAVIASIALTLAHSGHQAQAATPAMQLPACTTDIDCAALELDQAIRLGKAIAEDLTFDGASDWYEQDRPALADAFWAAHVGEDWTDVRPHLLDWVTAYRLAPAGTDCP